MKIVSFPVGYTKLRCDKNKNVTNSLMNMKKFSVLFVREHIHESKNNMTYCVIHHPRFFGCQIRYYYVFVNKFMRGDKSSFFFENISHIKASKQKIWTESMSISRYSRLRLMESP